MALDQSLLERIAHSLRITRTSYVSGLVDPAGSTEGGAADSAAAVPSGLASGIAGQAQVVRQGHSSRQGDSILTRAAQLYGAKPSEDHTPPTGFDPAAAALFEALVEGAFLVAHADGEFDDEERSAFEQVVLAATDKRVSRTQLAALLADLDSLLVEDGLDKRLQAVSRTIPKAEQQREVLRVAALIGQISGGVSDSERAAMEKLAQGFGLVGPAVEDAISDARGVLQA